MTFSIPSKSCLRILPIRGYPVISFHGQIVPINCQIVPQNSQVVPQNSQFVPHMLYLFSKWANVIWVQSSDQNMAESIFTTTGIYIIVRASYVNLISIFAQLVRANCRFLTTTHKKKKNRIKYSAAYVFVSALGVKLAMLVHSSELSHEQYLQFVLPISLLTLLP